MDDEARRAKNKTIKEKGKETRLRHASMRPAVIELKLDLKCLNNTERDRLFLYFTECRWLCNYLIGLDPISSRTSARGLAASRPLIRTASQLQGT